MTVPPPALDCAHTIEYAIVDDTVAFEQRHTLNVGGEWLGPVPKLAICRNLDETELVVFHCDTEWNVLGVAAGYNSVEDAKAKIERSYHGLASRWISSGYSRDEAASYVAEQFKGEECSFCGRSPLQCQSIVTGKTARICNHCVDKYYQATRREET